MLCGVFSECVVSEGISPNQLLIIIVEVSILLELMCVSETNNTENGQDCPHELAPTK